MSDENERVSNDLIRWLKMLALPAWAKMALALIMLLALSNALGLLIDGMLHKDKESIAAAVSILTVGLPIGLIVVALVFGDGGTRKLRQMTQQVLDKEVPQSIRENLAHRSSFSDAQLTFSSHVYITDYELTAKTALNPSKTLRFRIELNVKKVNVVFWIPKTAQTLGARALLENHSPFHACLLGAEREGYMLNPVTHTAEDASMVGVVFIKSFHDDFLLEPAHRLYFAQDFSFFVRGMLEASMSHE